MRCIYIYIRFNSLPLQQHRFYFKQHCICNLNILRWNPKQQQRVTLNGYFTIHLNTVNVVAPFRQNVKLCCAVTQSQTKANTAEILGKIVCVIILAPLPSLQKQPKQRWLSISFVNWQAVSYLHVVFQTIYAFEDMDRSNRSITWSMDSCSFFAIPCLCVTIGQTNCCPLFETKDAHSCERIDIAIGSKNQYDSKTAAWVNIKQTNTVVE